MPLLQRVAPILTCLQVDVTSANQTNLSSGPHMCIMRCGSYSLKPAVGTRVNRDKEQGLRFTLPQSLRPGSLSGSLSDSLGRPPRFKTRRHNLGGLGLDKR
jgi:hypothetical protein